MDLFTVGACGCCTWAMSATRSRPAVLKILAGQVDVPLALTGAQATIALEDLDPAIVVIAPRIIIPMHYWYRRGVLEIEPVDASCGANPRRL